MKKRADGTLTVFYALVFLSLLLLFGTLFEGVRAFETKKIVAEYEYLSLDNELAGYVRELWDDYHLLFMEKGREEEEPESGLPAGFINVTVNEEEPVSERYFTEEGVFAGQIADYMKYAALPELMKLLALGEKVATEGEKTDENVKKRLSTEEKCAAAEDIKVTVFDKTAELKQTHSDFMENAEFSDEDDTYNKDLIYRHVSDLLGSSKEIRKDISKYDSAYSESSALMKEYEEAAESDADYETLKSLMADGNRKVKNTRTALDSNEAKLLRIQEICKDEEAGSAEALALLNSVDYSGAEGAAKTGSGTAENEYKKKLGSLLSKGVLKLVLPADAEVSKKKIKKKDITGDFSGEGDNKVLTSIYLYKHFGNYLSLNEKDTALSYELEYLICGKGNDSDNLAGVAETLLSIRTGANLIKILKDPAKVAEASKLALAAAGATGNAAAVFAVKTAIITYWATSDAVANLKELFEGKKVDGLSYEQYLMTLVITKSNEKLLKRGANLLEENIRIRYMESFNIGSLYSKVSKSVKVTIHGTFTRDLTYEREFSRSY